MIAALLLLLVPTAPVMTLVHLERDSEFLRGIPSVSFPPHPKGTEHSACVDSAWFSMISHKQLHWTGASGQVSISNGFLCHGGKWVT